VAEKKFFVRPVTNATVGKAVADGLFAFAESLRLSAKAGFPVVMAPPPAPSWCYITRRAMCNTLILLKIWFY
jgi:hypothetical protein